MRIVLRALAVSFLLAAVFPAGAQLTISNALLRVDFDSGSGRFTATDLGTLRTFVSQGNFLLGSGGSTSVGIVSNAALGAGQAIQIAWPNGNSDAIMLFSNVPFAILQSTITNGTAQTVVSNRISPFTLQLDNGEPLTNLVTLGTGGLKLQPGSDPGSYEWLAVVDPANRNGVVGGWITDDRASGIVFSSTNSAGVRLSPRADYGRLQLLSGQSAPLEMFAVGYFADGRLGLEAWANTVAQIYSIHLPPQPDGYCTYPSVPNGGASSPAAVEQAADFASTNLNAFGFSMIQFDSGWQDGITTTNPNSGKSIGHRVFIQPSPTGAYAAGMQPPAAYETADGITPGVWFAPFGGAATDPYFTNHLDWFVKTTNGAPYWVDFAGTCLDMTYPPARDYLSNVVSQIANVWGYHYFKMDGFWSGSAVPQQYPNTGYHEDGMGDAVFSNPAKPNIEAYRDGIRLVRQAVGTNVFYDGCNIAQNMRSYGGTFGLLDGMRIGPDNGASWGSASGNGSGWLRSPLYGTRHYFLHGRIWYNDPDTAYVRTNFPLNQAQTIVSWYAVSGQLFLDGDWIPGLPPDRLDLLKRAMPHHGLPARPVDYFENDPPRIWLLTDTRHTPRRDVIGLFNWSTTVTQAFNVTLSHIGLPEANYIGFEFWSNAPVSLISGALQASVPPQSCEVIAVRPASAYPQLVSTSRHITQGIVDVLAETWDGTNTLSGSSQLVGGDSYEMRFCSTNGWQLLSASVSAADQAAGVSVAATQGNGLARVTLLSPTGRQVSWSAVFAPASTIVHPRFSGISPAAGGMVVQGGSGVAGATYYVLASTNVALPLASWPAIGTNLFDAGGNFIFTNPAGPVRQFFLLQRP